MGTAYDGLPTILGTGITGLATSHHLTKAGVKHLLIGNEPSDVPRFGESLDITGAMEFRDEFGDKYSAHTGAKTAVDFWAWGVVATQSTMLAKSVGSVGRFMAALARYPVPETLWHVERIGFDKAFYKDVVRSPLCLRLPGVIPEVQYDAKSDRVEALRLPDQTIVPSFTFDSSGVMLGISKCLKRSYSTTSQPLVAAFTHFENPASLHHHDWQHKTTIFLLRAETDGIDALISFIPVADIISLIITTEARPDLDAPTIHDLAVRAMERRGFPFPGMCPVRAGPRLVPHQYFMQERVVGKNWFMGGPPAGGVWFPSSSGVGLGMLAGRLAPKILKNPRKHGNRYQAYLSGLMKTHWWYHRYRRDVPNQDDPNALHDLYDMLTQLNLWRTLAYTRARGLILPSLLGRVFILIVQKGFLFHHFCRFTRPTPLEAGANGTKPAAAPARAS